MQKQDHIVYEEFAKINVNDIFFDSLRASYQGFNDWFHSKANEGKKAYVSYDTNQTVIAFLFLKFETGIEKGVEPLLDGPRIKIGTFKVDWNHHSSLGKRLLTIAMRKFAAYSDQYNKIYVTLFANDNTLGLEKLLKLYGFELFGTKDENELVFVKGVPSGGKSDSFKFFPFISKNSGRDYLLAILPKYHSLMFGDVDLQSEKNIPVKDTSSINNIEKIYLSASPNSKLLNFGDHVVAYRMSDNQGPAFYRSVVTSVGTVVEVKNITEFANLDDFENYINNKSIFTHDEILKFWRVKKYPWVIKFIYNFSFEKYPNRKLLIENNIISQDQRIVVSPIEKEGFVNILELGATNESFIID